MHSSQHYAPDEKREAAPNSLGITASIGFNYTYKDSICIHPSDMHFIWAQGRTLVIKSIDREHNSYLKGHDGRIVKIACSKKGNLIASGELMTTGFQAAVIVWDFANQEMLFRVRYHKEMIQSLSFSYDEVYLISLGGLNDGNQMVCWQLEEGRSECSQPATDQNHQECMDVVFYNCDRTRFVTAHNNAIKFWRIDEQAHRFKFIDTQLAHNKRFFNCLAIDGTDTFLYAGSRYGDVIVLNVASASYKRTGPVHKIFKGGVNSINCFFNDYLVVAAANGCLAKINKKTMVEEEEVNLCGGPIVSMANSQEKIYALTAKGNLHSVDVTQPLTTQTCFMTALSTPVGEIVWPAGFSEVFAVRSLDEIRIWNVADQKELLRICVSEAQGFSATCNTLQFMSDGKSIVSGWTDGMVRAFTPQSGKLLYSIKDAHRVGYDQVTQVSGMSPKIRYNGPEGVMCLSSSIDCNSIITGGSDCEVRLWSVGKQTQKLMISQRCHKAPIVAVRHIQNDYKAVSASIDGKIIIWDLTQTGKQGKLLSMIGQLDTPPSKGVDGQIVCGVTHLEYNTNQNQLLSLGLDRRITYWDIDSCKMVRQLQAGLEVSVNAFTLSPDGQLIVVGDEIGEVKVFTYDDCRLVHIETVHSAGVSCVGVCPNNTIIVTADEIGQMFFWSL